MAAPSVARTGYAPTVPGDAGLTYAEYLALEASSEVRHELVDGQVYAMAGGTRRHALVGTALVGALVARLRGTPCRPTGPDQRVYLPAFGQGLYPDASVVCGPREAHPADPDAITNPTVLFEVLSPSTEAWDRGGKFDRYASLDSVQEYALVSVDEERVEVFRRNEDGSWTRRLYRTGAVELASVGTSIAVDDIYGLVRAERAADAG